MMLPVCATRLSGSAGSTSSNHSRAFGTPSPKTASGRYCSVPDNAVDIVEPFRISDFGFRTFNPQFAIRNPQQSAARLLTDRPWIRSLGKLNFTVSTEGWKFPVPPGEATLPPAVRTAPMPPPPTIAAHRRPKARLLPSAETVLFKDRLLYLLQPPIESMFVGKQVSVPFPPYPYQLEGVAFLMPRHSALLADEMGLGKTIQAILALRLMLQAGL